mmetsp:Transcript_36750/g.91556  ORF Transcript_36750/g.91556 Transcript_36750/m.91556 type:complete len:257 (-) Transcript_36750:733-1503(-)
MFRKETIISKSYRAVFEASDGMPIRVGAEGRNRLQLDGGDAFARPRSPLETLVCLPQRVGRRGECVSRKWRRCAHAPPQPLSVLCDWGKLDCNVAFFAFFESGAGVARSGDGGGDEARRVAMPLGRPPARQRRHRQRHHRQRAFPQLARVLEAQQRFVRENERAQLSRNGQREECVYCDCCDGRQRQQSRSTTAGRERRSFERGRGGCGRQLRAHHRPLLQRKRRERGPLPQPQRGEVLGRGVGHTLDMRGPGGGG